jgi:hypothetical protein
VDFELMERVLSTLFLTAITGSPDHLITARMRA